jgi:hypothetical protein
MMSRSLTPFIAAWVGARIGKGQNDAAPTIIEGAHHAPLDQRRIERRFELREKLLALGFCELCCGHTSPPRLGAYVFRPND